MDTLTLYVDGFYISPYALSAFVALEEKGLPYRIEEVSLPEQQQKDASYRARTGRVPALKHGEYWLAESQAIAEYLAETFPFPHHPRLFPADLKERGICREVQAWLRSDLMPIREERSTETVWYRKSDQPLSPAAQRASEKLVAVCDQLITEGRNTLFDAWCIADIDLAMMLQRLNLNGDPLPKKVRAYAEANWARPSVQKWNALPRKPYVKY